METALRRVERTLLAALGLSACSADEQSRPAIIDIAPPLPLTGSPTAPVTTLTARPRPPGAGYVKEANGVIHRASKSACSSEMTTRTCQGTESHLSCKSDAECTERPMGRCASNEGMRGSSYCGCDYTCATDADCKQGEACVCGESAGAAHSLCVPASCTVDADCPAGVCAVSRYFNGCSTDTRLACKSPVDACKSDDDCAASGSHCVYAGREPGKSWSCRSMSCVVGRALVVDGRARTAPSTPSLDWIEPAATAGRFAAIEDAELLHRHWLDVAATEHASIASFARFTLELLSLGAPPELLVLAQRAMMDETRHARTAYTIAREYSGADRGPGPLPVAVHALDASLAAIVTSLVRDDAVGETQGAVEAQELAAIAITPERRAALTGIAEDELGHAVLAYRTLQWLLARFGPSVRDVAIQAVRRARAELAAAPPARDVENPSHGLLSARELTSLRERTLDAVVAPLVERLATPSAYSYQTFTTVTSAGPFGRTTVTTSPSHLPSRA